MGLDISVYRLHTKEEAKKRKKTDYDRFFTLSKESVEYFKAHGIGQYICKKKNVYYDFDKYFKDHGMNMSDYHWCMTDFTDDDIRWTFRRNDNDEEELVFLGKDCPTYAKFDNCVYYGEEVGYQRKGFNGKFYEDYRSGKIGYFVADKKELERYRDEYSQDWEGDEPGTMKKHFQENIIDKYVDGETVVTFDW